MIYPIKKAIRIPLTMSGIPRLVHRIFWPGRLMILVYHGIVKEDYPIEEWCLIREDAFRSQMEYLRRWFDVVPLTEAVRRLHLGKRGRPVAAITFDDGFQNNYDIAFPILRDLKLPATIFLTTKLIGSNDALWFGRINIALAETALDRLLWRGRHLDLKSFAARGEAAKQLKAALKEMPYQESMEEVEMIEHALGFDRGRIVAPGSPFRMLDRESIQIMVNSGLIEFGAHTCDHTILTRVDEGERRRQIERSIAEVRALTGKPCKSFAYPNGRAQDYDESCVRWLREFGIEVAVTSIEESNDSRTPILELRRYGIGPNTSMTKFVIRVHHAARWLL